jgi:lipopolysaccharide export system protein LptA
MPISIRRLRIWFVAALVFLCLLLVAVYFYSRHRVQNALKQIPGKIGLEIQQSAQGFTLSSSEQGRTIFTVQASKAVQFKQRAELHEVTITLYGRDSSRFDQVYGKDFEYDQQAGNIISKGEVSIDLEANPQGVLNPDQTAPKELKNPIHLRTRDLIFNQKTGDAWTAAGVEFSIPQASGSALGAKYSAKEGTLRLESEVRLVTSGALATAIVARQAVIEKNPRQIRLRSARADSPTEKAQADEVTVFLQNDNIVERAFASGDVSFQSAASPPASASADTLEVRMRPHDGIETAVLAGNVYVRNEGAEPAEASAGRAVVQFAGRNTVTKVSAGQGVRLVEHQHSGEGQGEDVEVRAPAMDFFVAEGRRLTRALTIGPPEIRLLPRQGQPGPETRITAGEFIARFDSLGQLASVHGEPDARIVSSAVNPATAPERVSSSDSVDGFFRPGTGIEALVEQGHFAYRSGTEQAWAARARYTPVNQILVLSGSPRIVDNGMATTARTLRLNRQTGEAEAEGEVKTTYSDLKPQPGGALLATSDPVHITADRMTAHSPAAEALYSGSVRLWQDANLISAPSIRFEKNQRMLEALSTADQKVSTILVGTDKRGKDTPVTINSTRLIYRDSERKAHFEGQVTVKGADLTITASQMDVFLAPQNGTSTTQAGGGPARLEKIIASGSVLLQAPNRHGAGEQLTYTAADDKFVLTGGPPSIFDAEHGKITGVSLTLFRRGDRVVVEGNSSLPAVTQTRVVR